jgi:hypothetical protein
MWYMIDADGVQMPGSVFRERRAYEAIRQKENKSMHIVWRQKLLDGTYPRIPDKCRNAADCDRWGKTELRLRNTESIPGRSKSIVHSLYSPEMDIVRISSTQWPYDAAMARTGERPQVPATVTLPRPEMSKEQIGAFNQEVRESTLETQNADKGFAHYVSHFKHRELVCAAIHVEQGLQGEYGWAVYFQQGRHRCVLTAVVSGRPSEEVLKDSMWKARAELANFQPMPGIEKEHEEHVYGMNGCTHCFEDQFQVYSEYCQQASPERKWLMEKFAAECARTRFEFYPSDSLQDRSVRHATNAASYSPGSQTEPVTSPDPGSLCTSGGWLVQFGRRVFGGPGEAGTG